MIALRGLRIDPIIFAKMSILSINANAITKVNISNMNVQAILANVGEKKLFT
jgi:hypothetical protein